MPANIPGRSGKLTIDGHALSRVMRRVAANEPRRSVWTWLLGRPLPTEEAPHQTIGKAIGLAVFSSDALSSTAYATQELMLILALVSLAVAWQWTIPLTLAIVALLAIVTLSYEQTIHAYPDGGGAYIVSRDNLGTLPSLIAAAALLTDYVLTVAVSISSGVAQMVSAFPSLHEERVLIACAMVLFIMLVNLRGVRESGMTFAIPTYFFIGTMYLTVMTGLYRHATGSLGVVVDPPALERTAVTSLSLFIILRAFASGTAALTGIEAISDGILAFRQPRSRNAGITLIVMALILGSLVTAISFLAVHIQAVPSEMETVISQIARTAFQGRGPLYLAAIASTTLILIMAANTAFADFPRLAAFAARDGFLPRQFTYRGSRLVFSRGIALLALVACLLIIVFRASVSALIPLYAVGVFVSFTLSQSGMARRWWKSGRLQPNHAVREAGSILRHDPRWRAKMIVNGVGAACTAVVAVVFAVTKFRDGAWVVVAVVPTLVLIFLRIHHHYAEIARRLSLDHYGAPPRPGRHRVILTIGGVHRGTLAGLRYARSLSDDVTAVHVSTDPEEAEKVQKKWEKWGEGVRLVILDSPYRTLIEPLMEYILEILSQRQPNEMITVVVPEFVPNRWWHNLLHTQAALWLRLAFLSVPGIVVTDVPYQLDRPEDDDGLPPAAMPPSSDGQGP